MLYYNSYLKDIYKPYLQAEVFRLGFFYCGKKVPAYGNKIANYFNFDTQKVFSQSNIYFNAAGLVYCCDNPTLFTDTQSTA